MMTVRDLTGQAFGLLTVREYVGARAGHSYWLCACVCGRTTEVQGSNLRTGQVRSCGCQGRIKKRIRQPYELDREAFEIIKQQDGEPLFTTDICASMAEPAKMTSLLTALHRLASQGLIRGVDHGTKGLAWSWDRPCWQGLQDAWDRIDAIRQRQNAA